MMSTTFPLLWFLDHFNLCTFKMPQDCHNRAWTAVGTYLKANMKVFGGKLADAESITLPEVRQWLRSTAMEMGSSVDDHACVFMVNCPGLGILGANAKSFLLNFVTNALVVHPNRASQQEGRTGLLNFFLF